MQKPGAVIAARSNGFTVHQVTDRKNNIKSGLGTISTCWLPQSKSHTGYIGKVQQQSRVKIDKKK